MQNLTKKNLDKQQMNTLFVRKPIHDDFHLNGTVKNNNNFLKEGNSNDFKQLSLDSTNSVSKLQLSDLLPSFSCGKKSEKIFLDYDKYEEGNINSKRKFFDFMDESKQKNSSLSYFNNIRVPHFALSQNNENVNRGNELLMTKKHKSVNQDNPEYESVPINSLENIKISKQSYISELSRNKKFKQEFCEKFYIEEDAEDSLDYLK